MAHEHGDDTDDTDYTPLLDIEVPVGKKYLMKKIDLTAIMLCRDDASDEAAARILTFFSFNMGLNVVVTGKKVRLAKQRMRMGMVRQLRGRQTLGNIFMFVLLLYLLIANYNKPIIQGDPK